jgi:hypothetical protein
VDNGAELNATGSAAGLGWDVEVGKEPDGTESTGTVRLANDSDLFVASTKSVTVTSGYLQTDGSSSYATAKIHGNLNMTGGVLNITDPLDTHYGSLEVL